MLFATSVNQISNLQMTIIVIFYPSMDLTSDECHMRISVIYYLTHSLSLSFYLKKFNSSYFILVLFLLFILRIRKQQPWLKKKNLLHYYNSWSLHVFHLVQTNYTHHPISTPIYYRENETRIMKYDRNLIGFLTLALHNVLFFSS